MKVQQLHSPACRCRHWAIIQSCITDARHAVNKRREIAHFLCLILITQKRCIIEYETKCNILSKTQYEDNFTEGFLDNDPDGLWSIHPSGCGEAGINPIWFGGHMGFTLGRLLICHFVNTKRNQSHCQHTTQRFRIIFDVSVTSIKHNTPSQPQQTLESLLVMKNLLRWNKEEILSFRTEHINKQRRVFEFPVWFLKEISPTRHPFLKALHCWLQSKIYMWRTDFTWCVGLRSSNYCGPETNICLLHHARFDRTYIYIALQ